MKKIIAVLLMTLLTTQCYAVTDIWRPTEPIGDTRFMNDVDDYQIANNNAVQRLLKRYREGCLLSYLTTATITVGLGEIMATDGTTYLMLSNTAATTVTWSDIDTGSEATSTTYYIYGGATSIEATTITFKISASSSAPTGLTYYRRLGSFYNNASGDITGISNDNYYTGLGSWESKTALTVYQASTDGFVIIGKNNNDDSVGIYSDSSNPPTTWRGGNRSAYSQVCCPVKRGDYYKGYHVPAYPSDFMYWIPQGE